ncbi:MAG TPA: helix-turn-helix transcriptional regulator [Bacteroidia bacterium]|nr:helix-turn-helix transcriptional regulator [Bacteroidia bacterium]
MNIGNAIKKIRTGKSLTQGDLSRMTIISQTSISQIEKGVKRPSQKNLQKICRALEVPETIVYFYGLEASDVPRNKKKLYSFVYPAIEEMVKKLIVD